MSTNAPNLNGHAYCHMDECFNLVTTDDVLCSDCEAKFNPFALEDGSMKASRGGRVFVLENPESGVPDSMDVPCIIREVDSFPRNFKHYDTVTAALIAWTAVLP